MRAHFCLKILQAGAVKGLNHAQEFVLVTPTHTHKHTHCSDDRSRGAVTDSDSQVTVESSIELVKDGRMFGSEWETAVCASGP